MRFTAGEIPNFLNGVSKQPMSVRLPSQAEEDINGVNSVADGHGKRPPREIIQKITMVSSETPFIHFIDRGTGERDVVIIDNNELKIYDIETGALKTYNAVFGLGYLSGSGSDRDKFQAITLADYTFIVNRTKTVKMNETAGFGMPGTFKGNKQTYADLPSSPTDGDVWHIYGNDTDPYDNYYVKWDSSEGVWVEWGKPSDGTAGSEPVDWNLDTMPFVLYPDPSGTYDYIFTQGDWASRAVGSVGDTSASWWPDETHLNGHMATPSIIEYEIRSIFFWRNRLGLLTRDNILLSEADNYFNFWRTSMTELLSLDPIDFAISHETNTQLKTAVPFDRRLFVFSDTAQFVVDAQGALSHTTITSDLATEFASSDIAEPVGLGNSLFFSVEKDETTALREYYVEEDGIRTNADDVSEHVPGYIPKDVHWIAANRNEDHVFLIPGLAGGGSNSGRDHYVYVYKQWYDGETKKQSAWNKWYFGGVRVHAAFAVDSYVYFITEYNGNGQGYIERVNLRSKVLNCEDMDFTIYLDHLSHAIGADIQYNAGADETTIFPIAGGIDDWPALEDIVVFKGADWGAAKGELIDAVKSISGSGLVLDGDWTEAGATKDLWIGIKYSMELTLSEQYLRDPKGVAVSWGRTQMRRMSVTCNDTGYLKAEVTAPGRNTQTYEFTDKALGTTWTLAELEIRDDVFSFPVMSNTHNLTIKFINDSHLPSWLIKAEWEAQYSKHTSRR